MYLRRKEIYARKPLKADQKQTTAKTTKKRCLQEIATQTEISPTKDRLCIIFVDPFALPFKVLSCLALSGHFSCGHATLQEALSV